MLFRLSLTVDVGELVRGPLTVGTYVEMLFGSRGVPQARDHKLQPVILRNMTSCNMTCHMSYVMTPLSLL